MFKNCVHNVPDNTVCPICEQITSTPSFYKKLKSLFAMLVSYNG